jgi:acyl-coenzyme A synthetase/AMP-(fatty) acid ligase
MHILDMVFHWAKMDPHRRALILPEMITTYAGLVDGIESVSSRIDKLDLDKREPVAVALANPALLVTTILALLRSGFSAAPAYRGLIPHLQPNGIKNLIYDVDGLVASGGRNIRFDPSWLPTGSQSGRPQPRPVGDVDIIFFTSGTTGLPKKFVQTRRAHEQRLALQRVSVDATRKSALILPGLSSSFGFGTTCAMLSAGKTACFTPPGEDSLHLIRLFRIDALIASTQQALDLAVLKESNRDLEVDSLQSIQIGGSRIGREGVNRIRAALCRNVINQYSSTEAGLVAVAPFDLIEAIPDAVGFVAPWAQVEIVDDAGLKLPDDRKGMIRCRTPQFLSNFGPLDGANADNRWFYPGDVGRLTGDGILCVSSRTTDIVNIGGTKLSASRIEEIVASIPEVREAAVCGVEDASGLEKLWIAIVPSGQIDPVQIKQSLAEHQDVGIAPEEVFLLKELPRGDLGKIQKVKLREMLLALKRKS